MKKTAFAFCTILAGLFSGCAMLPRGGASAKNAKPDWIEHWSLQYPSEQYLVGVGIGESLASAEDFARGEIAKVFSAQVNVEESASQSETDTSAAGKNDSAFSSRASMKVRTTSKKLLEGARIAGNWQDPSTGQFYALAVLNRAKAADALAHQISSLDGQIQNWQKDMDGPGPKLAKARDALRVVTALNERRGLSAELRVASPSGESIPSPEDQAQARSRAEKALAALTVTVKLTGDGAQSAQTGVVQGLERLGIAAKTDGTAPSPDLSVTGSVATMPVDLGQSLWKRASSQAQLQIRDEEAGKTILSLSPSVRADATDYNVAVQRSRQALTGEASKQIEEALLTYFTGQPQPQ